MRRTLPGDKTTALPSYPVMLLITCGVAFVCYFGSYMRIPVVPLYARSLGADTVQVGIINSAFFIMAAILSLPLGMLSDRLGRKLLASLGLFTLSFTSFLLYFSRTPVQLMGTYLLFGVGLAAFGPTMMSLVADFSPITHLGRSYGWYTTALYSAMSIGPAVGGMVAQRSGYLVVFLISGTIIFLTFWLLLFFLPNPHHVLSRTSNTGKTWRAAADLLKNRPLVACWLATLGGCFGLGMFITFIPLHAQNQNINIGHIGIIFAAQGITNALSRIPFGHMSDRASRRWSLVVVGSLGLAASMAGFSFADSVLYFLIFAATLGASMGLAFTSVGALIAEVVDPKLRGLAMGGYNSCIYLGMVLSSAFMGAVIHSIGFANAFLITALVNLVLTLLFYFLIRKASPVVQRPASSPGA